MLELEMEADVVHPLKHTQEVLCRGQFAARATNLSWSAKRFQGIVEHPVNVIDGALLLRDFFEVSPPDKVLDTVDVHTYGVVERKGIPGTGEQQIVHRGAAD